MTTLLVQLVQIRVLVLVLVLRRAPGILKHLITA